MSQALKNLSERVASTVTTVRAEGADVTESPKRAPKPQPKPKDKGKKNAQRSPFSPGQTAELDKRFGVVDAALSGMTESISALETAPEKVPAGAKGLASQLASATRENNLARMASEQLQELAIESNNVLAKKVDAAVASVTELVGPAVDRGMLESAVESAAKSADMISDASAAANEAASSADSAHAAATQAVASSAAAADAAEKAAEKAAERAINVVELLQRMGELEEMVGTLQQQVASLSEVENERTAVLDNPLLDSVRSSLALSDRIAAMVN